MAQTTELSATGVPGRRHTFTAKTGNLPSAVTPIVGACWAAGQVALPGFMAGEAYAPGFKQGQRVC